MFRQLLKNRIKRKKSKLDSVCNDINLFYYLLQKQNGTFDNWYFENVFNVPYWRFLKHYKYMETKELNKIHQGILSILFFMVYQYLDNKSDYILNVFDKIKNSVDSFSSKNVTTQKLKIIVSEILEMVDKKRKGELDIEQGGEIYKSITWTLKQIILKEKQLKGRSFG